MLAAKGHEHRGHLLAVPLAVFQRRDRRSCTTRSADGCSRESTRRTPGPCPRDASTPPVNSLASALHGRGAGLNAGAVLQIGFANLDRRFLRAGELIALVALILLEKRQLVMGHGATHTSPLARLGGRQQKLRDARRQLADRRFAALRLDLATRRSFVPDGPPAPAWWPAGRSRRRSPPARCRCSAE